MPDRPLQRVVRHHDRPTGARSRDLRQRPADVLSGQLAQGRPADTVDNGFEDVPIERDGLLRSALKTVTRPVRYRLANCVAAVRGVDPDIQVSVKLLELVLDFMPGAAASQTTAAGTTSCGSSPAEARS